MSDRRSRIAASIVALLAGAAAWVSAGTIGFTGGDAARVAALPPFSWLVIAMLVAVAAAGAARLRLDEAWPLTISSLVCLPFIPGRIPDVFLLWDGPTEAIVWALVVAGLLYVHAPNVAPAVVRLRGARRLDAASADRVVDRVVVAVLAMALSTFAFTEIRSAVPSGDEPHYLVATQSLIADGDLKVENNYTDGSYLDYFGGRLQPHFLQRSSSGEIYSIHSPGVSVAVLPAFAAAGYSGAVAMVILVAGLGAALTWTTAWRVSGSVAGAWVGVAAVFATAPFVFHTFTIYPDGIGALIVMAAVGVMVRLDESWEPTTRALAAIGGGLAILPWLHTRFVLLAGTLAVIVIARLAMRPGAPARLAAFLAVPAVAALGWFAYFWIIWGTPSPFAPYGRDIESSLSYVGRGLSGLLIDQQFGVLGTAPVYAMAAAGLAPMFRRRPRLTVELMLIAVPYVIAVSTYAMWWGGTSAPARFIAALLPLAAIAIACAWSIGWLRVPTLLLLVASAALIVPRIMVDAGRFVFTSRNVLDVTIEWLNRHIDLARALPSVHRDGAGAWLDAAPWLLAIGLVAGDAFAISRMRAGRGAAWTMTAFSAAVLAMASVWTAWAWHGAAGKTRDRSAVAALSASRDWHTSFVDVRTWSRIDRETFLRRTALDVPGDGTAALLRAARVPSGEYLVESTAPRAEGKVAVTVGRNDPLLESAPASTLTVHLPVALASLSVRADTTASGGGAMRITPVRVGRGVNAAGRAAVRAARYGRARVFFFDERAYLEPNGFWTRAEGRATVVIDADAAARTAGLPLAVTAGAAATTIGISVGDWSESYSFTPGERRIVTLPPLGVAAAWVVDIHSGPGFRPFQREPGSTDVRLLAAWFEIP